MQPNSTVGRSSIQIVLRHKIFYVELNKWSLNCKVSLQLAATHSMHSGVNVTCYIDLCILVYINYI
jgi:hypothetical protein